MGKTRRTEHCSSGTLKSSNSRGHSFRDTERFEYIPRRVLGRVMKYTIVLEFSQDDGAYLVSVPAFPEVHTYGETVEEAAANAKEAIELAIEMYQEEGRGLPEDPVVVVEVAP